MGDTGSSGLRALGGTIRMLCDKLRLSLRQDLFVCLGGELGFIEFGEQVRPCLLYTSCTA